MKAEILSIGAELLVGAIVDTNAAFLARELVELGIDLRRTTVVGDDLQDLMAVLDEALDRADLIVRTGGIGPTPDDLTREAIAGVLGEQMSVSPELEATLRSYFAQRTYPMPERNLKQATLIPSATAVHNRSGTAPGWWVEARDAVIVTMPGVPREMKTIWAEEIVPRLAGRSGVFITLRTLKTSGLGESTAAEMLGPLLEVANPAVATYAKLDGVHVVVKAAAPTAEAAASLADTAEAEALRILGPAVWSRSNDSLPTVVAELLERLGLTLSAQEGATGGAVALALSSLSNKSFVGGVVGAGTPPLKGDLALVVGPREQASADGRTAHSCGLTLRRGDEELAASQVVAASPEALAERAVIAALHLLRQSLAATPTALR